MVLHTPLLSMLFDSLLGNLAVLQSVNEFCMSNMVLSAGSYVFYTSQDNPQVLSAILGMLVSGKLVHLNVIDFESLTCCPNELYHHRIDRKY